MLAVVNRVGEGASAWFCGTGARIRNRPREPLPTRHHFWRDAIVVPVGERGPGAARVSTANIAVAADFKKYRRPPRLGAKGTGQLFMALLSKTWW